MSSVSITPQIALLELQLLQKNKEHRSDHAGKGGEVVPTQRLVLEGDEGEDGEHEERDHLLDDF